MRLKANYGLIVSLILLAFFFIYFKTKIDFQEIGTIIDQGIWYDLIFAFLSGGLMVFFQSYLILQIFKIVESKITFGQAVKTWLMMISAGVFTLGLAGPALIYSLARKDKNPIASTKITLLFYFFYITPITLLIILTGIYFIKVGILLYIPQFNLLLISLIIFFAGIFYFGFNWIKNFIKKNFTKDKEKLKVFSKLKLTDFISLFLISIVEVVFNFLTLYFVLKGFQIEDSFMIAVKNLAVIVFVSLFSPSGSGIGFVEIGMSSGLMLFGVKATPALAVVIIYRLFNFWLPFFIGSVILSHQWPTLLPILKNNKETSL